MRPAGDGKQLERRRQRAIALLKEGVLRLKWRDWWEWIGAVSGAGTPHTGCRGRADWRRDQCRAVPRN
jgi:hypothetical protein